MEQNITVSVIIPVYQAESTLRETLESVRAQTFREFEAVIVDDGSTDGSREIYEAFSGLLPSCQLVKQDNAGVSAARNNGIRHARGKYILFLDSDDLLGKTALESMVKAAEEYRADLVIGNYVIFRENEDTRGKNPWLNDMKSYAWLMNAGDVLSLFGDERSSLLGVCVWGKLYRRDLILEYGMKFPEEVNYEEDCQFNVQYYRRISRAVRLRETVNYYRIKEQSLSRTYRESQFGFLVDGYHLRRNLAAEMGPEELPEKIDSVFYSVVLMQVKKASRSSLAPKEKRRAYQNILSREESKQALRIRRDDVTRFTRLLARACLKERYPEMDFLLFLWGKKKQMERLSDGLSD